MGKYLPAMRRKPFAIIELRIVPTPNDHATNETYFALLHCRMSFPVGGNWKIATLLTNNKAAAERLKLEKARSR